MRPASPEQVQVVLFHMGQRQQGGLVQPAALHDHLHQVADADGRNQPAFVGGNIQHRLGNHSRVKTNVCVCVCPAYLCVCGGASPYLADADGVVQHGLGVGGVVAAGQLGVAKVRLQQQVGLGVGAVVGVRVDLQGELLSQLAVQLVLVVSHRQLRVLLSVLRTEIDGTG